ncbi:hypothetical protein ACJ72_06639 [Emergomyces africanus]|uniref:Uncharacterized protein n=1 Tax=Emergomyces africanus TaxID=1955775 RepID=A0A1B7NQH8_9EURO|nr:hypothetical protein ACJ72_06639 [Emergomyces africanus]
MSMRSPYQNANFGTRPSWGSTSQVEQQQLPGRLQYPQAESRERREPCSSTEYGYRSPPEWSRSVVDHRHLSPIVTYMPELAAISSPSTSEMSNSISAGPPSMVSDHNSICSSSPRTATSPSLLPMPVEIHTGQDERRRGSAPTLRSLSSSVGHEESYYDSSCRKNIEESAVLRRWAPNISTSLPQEPPRLQHWKHQHSNSAPQNKLAPATKPRTQAPSPPRDSRMGLETLLN